MVLLSLAVSCHDMQYGLGCIMAGLVLRVLRIRIEGYG